MTFTAPVAVSDVAAPCDVVDLLARQHAALRSSLETAFSATGTTRYRAVRALRDRLLVHLDAEHRILDPVVRAELDDGRHILAVLRRHEDSMRRLLAQLASLGDYAEEYSDVLTRFETSLVGHLAVTEAELFPALREVLTPSARRRLGEQLRAARFRRPGRPAQPRSA